MLALLAPMLKRHDDEGRAFLKALFQTPGDLIPHNNGRELRVRFHSMANPRFNNALRALCEALASELSLTTCLQYDGSTGCLLAMACKSLFDCHCDLSGARTNSRFRARPT